MNKWMIPLHNWYNTIAIGFLSNFPDLASISLTPASNSHVSLDCIQNHESESMTNKNPLKTSHELMNRELYTLHWVPHAFLQSQIYINKFQNKNLNSVDSD